MKELIHQLHELRAGLEALERRVAELEQREYQRSMPQDAGVEAGHRKSPRKKGLMRVDCGTGSAFFSGIATDVSEGGMGIQTDRRHEVGSYLNLVFSLPGEARPLKAKGEVARVSEIRGEHGEMNKFSLGVRFVSMDMVVQRKLKDFVRSLPAEARQTSFDENQPTVWNDKLKDAGL
ncbi:MAG: PilZ domain-containing protein [Pseudomonadota bacterium]